MKPSLSLFGYAVRLFGCIDLIDPLFVAGIFGHRIDRRHRLLELGDVGFTDDAPLLLGLGQIVVLCLVPRLDLECSRLSGGVFQCFFICGAQVVSEFL